MRWRNTKRTLWIVAGIIAIGAIAFGVLFYYAGKFAPGTHGSIKNYSYDVSKYELEEVIHDIIIENPSISRDTIYNYYNDGVNYITISISKTDTIKEFVFRYYGDEQFWEDNPGYSEIFICYIRNKSKGRPRTTAERKKQFKANREYSLSLFETELIGRIEAILNERNTENN